ncbi:adenosylhomocysteinase [Candidatus Nitrosocosmicus sp. SS]|uniref:adenosylhomocysteinase n=1 Tax=Candidatus Nitrosocosmicus agrestis TaxID=2563600 RepID=UPI00210358C3|nr:adenosylhomocysteinase [Candidatus Nitrosocosmicus sp. SS]
MKNSNQNGQKKYLWAKNQMPILRKLVQKYSQNNTLKGLDIGVCLHITKETSVLIMGLKETGANVSLCSANPLSTKTEVRDFLKESGIRIFTDKNYNLDSFYSNMDKVLDTKPQIIIDDGGELHKKAIRRKDPIRGGTEETTSGVNRLRALSDIPYPVIAVNQSITKHLFDNTFGTGQSIMESIIKTTSVLIASKRIVVCGYGWVGKGVSKYARGMGAKVSVTETNPLKAIEAYLDGFEVARLDKLLSHNDIFITCTGQINVIGRQHFDYLKDGAILCNAGHFDVEIDVKALDAIDPDAFEPVQNVTCYKIRDGLNKKKVFLLARGRVVNLIGSEGNSPQVMDLSFTNQFLSIIYLFKYMEKLPKKVSPPPNKIQNQISKLALQAFGLDIDNLTLQQKEYFKS